MFATIFKVGNKCIYCCVSVKVYHNAEKLGIESRCILDNKYALGQIGHTIVCGLFGGT